MEGFSQPFPYIFLFCGFWHGASWGYVIWGAAYGIAMAAHKQMRSQTPQRNDPNAPACLWSNNWLGIHDSICSPFQIVFQSPSLELMDILPAYFYTIGLGRRHFGFGYCHWIEWLFWASDRKMDFRQMLALPNMLYWRTQCWPYLLFYFCVKGSSPYLYFRF